MHIIETSLLYIIAMISGAMGGGLVAAHHALRGRNVTAIYICAYIFTGLVFGLTGIIVTVVFTPVDLDVERAFLVSLIFGIVGAVTLAGMNLSARILLRRFGIEVEMNITRTQKP